MSATSSTPLSLRPRLRPESHASASGNPVDALVKRLALCNFSNRIVSQAREFFPKASRTLRSINSQGVAAVCLLISSKLNAHPIDLYDSFMKHSTLGPRIFKQAVTEVQSLFDSKSKITVDSMLVRFGIPEAKDPVYKLIGDCLKRYPNMPEKLAAGAVIFLVAKALKTRIGQLDMIWFLGVKKEIFQNALDLLNVNYEKDLADIAERYGAKSSRKRNREQDTDDNFEPNSGSGRSKRKRYETDEDDDDDEYDSEIDDSEDEEDESEEEQITTPSGPRRSQRLSNDIEPLSSRPSALNRRTPSKNATPSSAKSNRSAVGRPQGQENVLRGPALQLAPKFLEAMRRKRDVADNSVATSPLAKTPQRCAEDDDDLMKDDEEEEGPRSGRRRIARGVGGGSTTPRKIPTRSKGIDVEHPMNPTQEEEAAERAKEKFFLSVIGQPTMLVYGDDQDFESTGRFKKYDEWRKGMVGLLNKLIKQSASSEGPVASEDTSENQ
ncbi:hypothetical protein HDU67_000165 [Dinochytrium kinnereticum]|nr:hypothetical protein HDU67_000165 [Dinochytrium kinnereticum]